MVRDVIRATPEFLPYIRDRGYEAFIIDIQDLEKPIGINDEVNLDLMVSYRSWTAEGKLCYYFNSLRTKRKGTPTIILAHQVPKLDKPTRTRLVDLTNELLRREAQEIVAPKKDEIREAKHHGIHVE